MADAWLRFEALRWDGPPPSCPRCGTAGGCSLLPNPCGARRVWRCRACRAQFSVLTGTLLERTRVPLPVWQAVAADVVAGDLSARELARRHSVTPETVRVLRSRMRAAGVAQAGSAEEVLAHLLRLPGAEVERIRRATPARRAGQYGPSGDYA